MRLWSRCFLVKFAKFAEHQRKTASDCSSIISSKEIIGKQNRKLLKKAVEVKEQVPEAVVCRLQIRCS